MLVYHGAFRGKRMGVMTYVTAFPGRSAQAVYQPYPQGSGRSASARPALSPAPRPVDEGSSSALEFDVPASMRPLDPVAGAGPEGAFSVAAAVLAIGSIFTALVA